MTSEYIYRLDETGEIRRGVFRYPERRFYCVGCGDDVTDEFFMIHHHLWDEYIRHGGWMCVSCVERRLGRELTRDDFILCPINVTTFRKTDRLLARMGGEPLNHEDLLRTNQPARPPRHYGQHGDTSTTG
jgi:hypothetical protein